MHNNEHQRQKEETVKTNSLDLKISKAISFFSFVRCVTLKSAETLKSILLVDHFFAMGFALVGIDGDDDDGRSYSVFFVFVFAFRSRTKNNTSVCVCVVFKSVCRIPSH